LRATLLFAAVLGCPASEPVSARWEGFVQIPGRELTIVIDLAQDGRGQWIGSAIAPGFGVKGAPLKDIVAKDSDVMFTVKGALGEPKLTGRLGGHDLLTGDYQQAGNTAPFTLQKAGPPQVDPPRESTGIRKELEGEWQGEMTFVGNPLRVRLKLENHADGKATGQMVFIGKRETTLAVDLVTQDADLLTLELLEPGMTFDGRFYKAANEITGTFQQGPFDAPLILRPAAKTGAGGRP
jgi:hypothetical protein